MSFVHSGLLTESITQKGNGKDLLPTGEHHKLERVQHWTATGAIIIAEIVGTGVLSLGGSFAKQGTVGGVVILFGFLLVNIFTSLLLGYVAQVVPDVVTLGDAAHKLIGPWWGFFGYASLYVYIFFAIAGYVFVLSDSVRSVAYTIDICRPWATLIACALLVPCNQLRTLSSLTVLSVVSFITIVSTVVLCLVTMLMAGEDSCTKGEPAPVTFWDYNSAVCAFIFAYSGQAIMLELQAEMKDTRHFPRAVNSAFPTLFLVYLSVSLVCYTTCGLRTPGELLNVLQPGPVQVVAGSLMVIHLVITYTILQQVLTRAMCGFFVQGALSKGPTARVKWFMVSSSIMVAAWTVANVLPVFGDIVSLTGGALGSQISFTIPAMLYLTIYRQGKLKGLGVSPSMQKLMAALSVGAVVIGVYATVLGTASTLLVMAGDLQKGGNAPFGCKLE